MIENDNSITYMQFSNAKLDYNHCFLCGSILTKDTATVEHVFPKWLQNKHNLWNQKLTLMNKTYIQYKELTIPCCKTCNSICLSNLENHINKAINEGYEKFLELNKLLVVQWMAKIFFGLLFKNLNLPIERKYPSKENLITPKILELYKLLHEFLQSIRMKISFNKDIFSLFVFNLHRNSEGKSESEFFYSDDIGREQIAIYSGEIGIICCFGEDGIIKKTLNNYLKQFYAYKIHLVQFLEIVGRVFYQRSILLVSPTYILITSKDGYLMISNSYSVSNVYFDINK